MSKTSTKEIIKSGFIFYLFSAAIVAVQFVTYLTCSPQAEFMDGLGNVFYLTASMSHAAIVALVPFIVFLIVTLVTRNKLAADITHVALVALLCVFLYINGRVYALYRFHINGLMLAMFFGDGGGDIFQIDASIYLKITAVILAIIAICIALKLAANRIFATTHKSMFVPALIIILSLTFFSNGTHAYAAVAQRYSVVKSAACLPYYFPMTATRFFIKIGIVSQDDLLKADFGSRTGLNYPQNPIVLNDSAPKSNIVLIVIDSWNYRGLTPEVMPNSTRFAADNHFYTNHLSSSNGTRGSIFGMFYGVSSYYWRDFDISGTTPVLVDELQNCDYQINAFASATLTNPNFAKLLFRKTNIKGDTKGEYAYERDCQLTRDFTEWLDTINTNRPFFALLFYDLAHSFDYPIELQKKFTPSWDFADYMKLNNDVDPTPFWNLYCNCLNAVDSLIGIALNSLKEKELTDNTYIILTGDHSQEFNENHKNYWGHNGNYSYPQIHVPLAIHTPDCQSDTITYRTTHYDISATLLHDVLGAVNPSSDYCMGRPLSDTTFRNWHVVGDNLNYAFIIDSNIIVEKRPNGMIDITDNQLNPLKNYKLKAADLNKAINRLNAFYAE